MNGDESFDSEALPCPFCGGKAIVKDWGSIVEMRCKPCGVFGPSGPTRGQAIAKWNRRAKTGGEA
jgi:Lar family restriction alleviation protein